MSSRRRMLEFLSLSRLPAEYQEVEYIESTGTQYIDTGATITNDIKVNVRVSFTQFGIGANENVIFSNGSYAPNNFLLLTSSTTLYWFGDGNEVAQNLIVDTKYNIEITKTYINFNGTQTEQTDSANGTLYLMYTLSPSRGFKGKLYSCKIYDNRTIVRDFVPCYRKSDNVIGLFDTINQVFYTNAGTGTFLKGADI